MNSCPSPKFRIKILAVEDSLRDFALMEARLLTALPCFLNLATSENEFEQALAHNCPDVIVCDSSFFAFDGLTALRIAREKRPHVPFIFCSGGTPNPLPA